MLTSIFTYLQKSPENVVVLHSFGVPDRNTALVTIAALMLENVVNTTEQALWFYSDKVAPPKMGLNAGQRRLLAQVQDICSGEGSPETGLKIKFTKISCSGLPGFSRDRRTVKPFFEFLVDGRKEYSSFQSFESLSEYAAGGSVQNSLTLSVLPCKVLQVNAYHARQILGGKISIDKMNNIRMFSCSFDTCMMELDETAQYIKFSAERGELDIEDNNEGHFPPGFEVKIEVQVDKNHQTIKERPWEKLAGLYESGLVVSTAEKAGIVQNYGSIPGMGQKKLKIKVHPELASKQNHRQNNSQKPVSNQNSAHHNSAQSSRNEYSHPYDRENSESLMEQNDTSAYSQIQEEPAHGAKEENLFDFADFSSNLPSSQASGPPRPPSRDYNQPMKIPNSSDNADLLGFGTTSTNNSNQQSFDPFASWADPPKSTRVNNNVKPQTSNNSMTADLLNFSSNAPSSNISKSFSSQNSSNTVQPATTFDPFAGLSFPTSTSTSKPAPPSPKPTSNSNSSTSFDPFGTFNLPQSKPAQSKPAQNQPAPKNKTTPPKKAGINIDLGNLGFNNDFGTQAPKTVGEKFEAGQEEAMGDPIKYKIWLWTKGKEGNIRTLLSSMQDVLWENENRWKSITLADMLEPNQVKKQYRKASLIVHPDKTSGSEHETLAHEIQMVLNEAWATFEEKNY
jgi:hypothetical protein